MTKITLSENLTDSLDAIGFEPLRGETCITCSDEGRPLTILRLESDGVTALAEADGKEETVDVSLVGTVAPGDKILVHAGLAITKVEG